MRIARKALTKPGAWRVVAVLAVMLVPLVAFAGPVPVRSGEHDGFTRLVLDLPQPAGWTIARDGREAKVILSGPHRSFDTSDAFRRLTTTRLIGIEPLGQENGLALSLGCDCSLSAYRVGAAMLVVDIAGTVDTPEPPKAAGRTGPVARDRHPPGIFLLPDNPLPPGFGPAMAPREHHSPFATTAEPPEHPAEHPPGNTPPETDRAILVNEAERRLAEQLGRAVAQGLVTPRATGLPEPDRADPAAESHAKPEEPATHPATATAEPPATPGINLRAETSADRDFLALLDSMKTTRGGARCLPDRELDIAAWGSERSFGEQVGPLRARLTREFDRPSADAERALARLYIHFGFGAEALQLLRNTAMPETDRALLTQLGEIMESGQARGHGPLTGLHDCDGAAALWATLADDPIPPGQVPDGKAILRTLSALPPHLRRHVGPVLSARLLAHGNRDLAAQVLRIVERGDNGPNPATALARAEMDLSRGKHAEASEALSSVVEANTYLSAEALIRLVDTRLASGTPVDHQLAELAGAYAQEYRKQPIGADLGRVYIIALAESGAYDQAFAELATFSSSATAENQRLVRSRVMAALARDGGEMPFLKHALAPPASGQADIERQAANAVAERLLTLGFPVEADSYLRQPSEAPVAEHTRRLLRARAALAQLEPRRAEADLLGLRDEEADRLRARARSMDGDHETAARILARLEDRPGTEREAWLAADWAALGTAGDAVLAQAAQMAAGRTRPETSGANPAPPDSTRPAGTLARNRALLDESAGARDTIEALLGHLQPPQDP